MSEVSLSTLMDLDWVTVTDLSDEDGVSAEMEVVNEALKRDCDATAR